MAYQRAIIWRNAVRETMFSTVLRNQTDWNLVSDLDIVNAGASGIISSAGGTVYGILIDSIYDVASTNLTVVFTDLATQTLTAEAGEADFGAAIWGDHTEEVLALKIPRATAATAPQIHSYVFPNGLVYATVLQVAADGTEGTAPTANDVRVHVVYRTSTSRA